MAAGSSALLRDAGSAGRTPPEAPCAGGPTHTAARAAAAAVGTEVSHARSPSLGQTSAEAELAPPTSCHTNRAAEAGGRGGVCEPLTARTRAHRPQVPAAAGA